MSKPRARISGSASSDVLARGEIVEQVHDLERARDALARDRARRQAGDVLAREHDAPARPAGSGR